MMTQETKRSEIRESLVRDPLTRAFDLCIRKTRQLIRCLADEPKSATSGGGKHFEFNEGFYE